MLTKRQRILKAYKKISTYLLLSNGYPTRPLFIFGEMRSGTNMLINALDRSQYAECYHESDDEAFDNYVLRDYEIINRIIKKSKAKIIVFKPLAESQQANNILSKYVDSKGIWIYRRYQDVVNSALKNWVEHKQYLHYILYDQVKAGWRTVNIDEETKELIKHFYEADISDASARALIWYIRNRFYFKLRLHENSNVLLLNYERLVTDSLREFSHICKFLDLPDGSRLSKGIHSTSIGKTPVPNIESEIKKLCDELFNQLEDVYENTVLSKH